MASNQLLFAFTYYTFIRDLTVLLFAALVFLLNVKQSFLGWVDVYASICQVALLSAICQVHDKSCYWLSCWNKSWNWPSHFKFCYWPSSWKKLILAKLLNKMLLLAKLLNKMLLLAKLLNKSLLLAKLLYILLLAKLLYILLLAKLLYILLLATLVKNAAIGQVALHSAIGHIGEKCCYWQSLQPSSPC